MLTVQASKSRLLVIDIQQKLMPVIHAADVVIANAKRLIDVARLLDVPIVHTEQYPKGLGATVGELSLDASNAFHKMTFDAARTVDFRDQVPRNADVIVCGCEAHVCVLQTVLGLLDVNRRVFVVADAVGSRRDDNRVAAIERMRHHGAEIVTTEMVAFEWLESAEHPRFREVVKLIK